MHHDFGVGMGAETVSVFFQLLAQLSIIINLAVERDPDRFVLVAHGLLSRWGKINDAQALMPEADTDPGAVMDDLAFVVGASMGERAAHAAEDLRIDFSVLAQIS